MIDPAFGVAGPTPKYVLRSLEAESWAVDGEKFLTGTIHEGSITGLGVQVLRNIRRFGFHNLPGERNETLARMLAAMPELEHLLLFRKAVRDPLELPHLIDTVRNVCPALRSLSLHGPWPVVLEPLYSAEAAKWLPELHLKVAMSNAYPLGSSPEDVTEDVLRSHWEGAKMEKIFVSMDPEVEFIPPVQIALQLRAWLPWCAIEARYTNPPHDPDTSHHLMELNRFLKHYATLESVQAIFAALPSDNED